MTSILFLLGSARRDGNAEILAIEAAKSILPNVNQQWIRLSDHPLGPFHDVRHEGERSYEMPSGNAKTLMEETLSADTIVFVCPVYWYSLPAPAKLYLDHWSHWMRVSGLDFRTKMKGKRMFLISAMAGDAASESDPLVSSLKLTANYMGMAWGGHVLAHANAAGDVSKQPKTLGLANRLFISSK